MSMSLKRNFLSLFTTNYVKNNLNAKLFHTTNVKSGRVHNRKVQRVMTSQEEAALLKDSGTKLGSPALDAFTPFEPSDPVQKMMKEAVNKPQNSDLKRNLSQRDILRGTKKLDIRTLKYKNDTNIEYEFLKEGNPKLSTLVIGAKSRKQREKTGNILLEGHRLITDAILCGAEVQSIFFTDEETLKSIPFMKSNSSLYKVAYKNMKIWSDMKTPPGIIAICEMPTVGGSLIPDREPLPLTLVCDNVRDPGNMGTLIRTAAAVGCQSVIATRGCVDLWEPKVLRSGAGAHFNIPLYTGIDWEYVSNYMSDDKNVFIADVLKMSSEVSPVIDSETANRLLSVSEESQNNDATVTLENEELYEDAPIPSTIYSKGNFHKNKDTVLIIGGETEGISVQAKKFTFDNYGEILSIPMTSRINSLNSSVAASVILYEIRRQLCQ